MLDMFHFWACSSANEIQYQMCPFLYVPQCLLEGILLIAERNPLGVSQLTLWSCLIGIIYYIHDT